jgi:hypothetical protein
MISNHPYSRYALALVMNQQELDSIDRLKPRHLLQLVKEGLEHFRMRPIDTSDETKVQFDFVKASYLQKHSKYISSHCNEGFFLAPNILSSDKGSKHAWNGLLKIQKELENGSRYDSSESATMSIMPMAAKFNNGKMSQSPPKITLLEACLCAITTSTPHKPSLHTREKQSKGYTYVSTAIIPDLPLQELRRFITVFQEMHRTQTRDLMTGKINRDGNTLQYFRPNLSNGNFPHAPRRHELASAALLAAIGRFAKEAEYPQSQIEDVLEKLQNAPLYIVSYGKAQVVSYSHYVVALAKSDRLSTIIDALHSVYWMVYLPNDTRKVRQQKFEQFIFFAARFLQLFHNHAFKRFLSVRAEYPKELTILFTTFFRRIMKIDDSLVKSAASLGRWLNRVAYFAAREEVENKTKDGNAIDKAEVTKLKAKIIVELESAALSAKSATALVSHVITRAGRISGQDAPSEALPFTQAVTTGSLGESEKESLENAKNMIVTFARIRSTSELVSAEVETGDATEEEESLSEDEKE